MSASPASIDIANLVVDYGEVLCHAADPAGLAEMARVVGVERVPAGRRAGPRRGLDEGERVAPPRRGHAAEQARRQVERHERPGTLAGRASRELDALEAAGVRVEVDDRGEKMGLKIREATMRKTPYMLVVGEEEAAAGTVSVRTYRTGEKPAMTIAEVAAEIAELVRSRTFDVDIKPLRTFDDVEDTAAAAGADEY